MWVVVFKRHFKGPLCPNLGLRLEAGTKLNTNNITITTMQYTGTKRKKISKTASKQVGFDLTNKSQVLG